MTAEGPIGAAAERFLEHAARGERHAAIAALLQAAGWGAAAPEYRAGLWRWVREQTDDDPEPAHFLDHDTPRDPRLQENLSPAPEGGPCARKS